MRALALLLLVAGCGPPPVLDYATEFLETACKAPPGPEFGREWLDYEKRHWGFYQRIYYREKEWAAQRPVLAKELSGRRDELCGHTRVFMTVAPAVVAKMRPRVADLMGAEPDAVVAFAAALQWTDGRTATWSGRDLIVLNARHDTFARVRGLVATITHELIHSARDRRYPTTLPMLLDKLYREGGAVFGVQVLLPEIGDRAVGMRPEHRKAAPDSVRAVATAMQPLLDRDLGWRDVAPWFMGGWRGAHPPKMGYYLGMKIFRDMADRTSEREAAQASPEQFAVHARRLFAQWAE